MRGIFSQIFPNPNAYVNADAKMMSPPLRHGPARRQTSKLLNQQFRRSQVFHRHILICFQPWPIGRSNP
jgi:hypothetical protein